MTHHHHSHTGQAGTEEVLGARLRRLREERKQSLQDVASAIGGTKAHLWSLEQGQSCNPSLGLLKALSVHFGVSVSYLIGETDADLSFAQKQLRKLLKSPRICHCDLSGEFHDITDGCCELCEKGATLTPASADARATDIMHAISKCGPISLSNDRWCLGHELITAALLARAATAREGQTHTPASGALKIEEADRG